MLDNKDYWSYDDEITTPSSADKMLSKEEIKEQSELKRASDLVDKVDKDLLLKNIEEEVNSKIFDIAEKNFKAVWEGFYVPNEVIDEFLNKIKEVWKELLLADELTDEQLQKIFWEDVSALKKYPFFTWNIKYFNLLYYVKKLCPDNYVVTMNAIMPVFMWFADNAIMDVKLLNAKLNNEGEVYRYLYSFVEKYWSKSADMINYFIARDWTYLKEWTSSMVKAMLDVSEKNNDQDHEQKTDTVNWGDDLNHALTEDSWEAVITPRAWENSNYEEKYESDLEKYSQMWSAFQFYESFIFEPEWVNLFEYLKDTPVKLSNLWWKVISEIDLNTERWINFCFHWIISMIKTRDDINFPVYKENMSDKEKTEWKKQWDKIIKEYETLLRNYISQDFTTNESWEKVEKPRNMTFNKVFYLSPRWDDVLDNYRVSHDVVQWLTSKPVSDFIYQKTGDKDNDNISGKNQFEQFSDELKTYLSENPNDKILVCINEHWSSDWSSANTMMKEDWLNLANLSENINIWSIRCYFWSAFETEQVSGLKSSVSWYSMNTPALGPVVKSIDEAAKLWLWYHEMEIYSRLKYLTTVTPLSESMSYTNWNTWETEIGKVWLAQNDNCSEIGDWVDFA